MAGRIPQDFIDELLTRVDIVDIVDARVPLKRAGKEFKACCPFHDEKSPSFTVSQSKQFYHCFGCGAHGTAISFLMEHDGQAFRDAVEELAASAGMSMPAEESSSDGQSRYINDLLAVLADAADWYARQLREHKDAKHATDYLKSRGLTGEIAKTFGLGFAPDSWEALTAALGGGSAEKMKALVGAGLAKARDRSGHYNLFRSRIMFPIVDHRGRVVAFGGRILGDGEPKYLNSPETPLFHKGRELYGLYQARRAIRDAGTVLVVEGYMDVVALAQHGIDNAVATLGTATTVQHLQRLFRHANHVIFCFDGDAAGRRAAAKALDIALGELQDGRQMSFLFLPDGHDPDSLVREEGDVAFKQRLEAATPLSAFYFDQLAQQTDLERDDGRARLIALARKQLARIPGDVIRQLLIEQLAELSKVSSDRVAAQIETEVSDRRLPRARPLRRAAARDNRLTTQVIRMLLNRPDLALRAGELSEVQSTGNRAHTILIELLDTARDNPSLNTAAFVERYRGRDFHPRLEVLAGESHLIEESKLDMEFDAALLKLRIDAQSHAMSAMLHPADGTSQVDSARYREMQVGLTRLKTALAEHEADTPTTNGAETL